MSENIELLFNIKEIQICWTEECTTDARIITLPSQTSTRSSRLPVSYPLWLLVAAFRELTVSLPPPFDAFRWQTHDPILEEKCRLKPRWHPQAQIARHVPHRPHQEIRRPRLRWQINSFWSQRQVSYHLINRCAGLFALSWSRRSSRWRDWCSRRRDPLRRARRASQRERRSERTACVLIAASEWFSQWH